MFLLSGFESERLRFMTNYNEWLIGLGKLEDHGHISLNEFESERFGFFTIYFHLVRLSQKGLGS